MKVTTLVRCIMLAAFAAVPLMGASSALAAQAGGSIQLISASPNLLEGQVFNVTVSLVNTSTEDTGNGGAGIPAVFKVGGDVEVILACTASNCISQIPDTLEFVSCIAPANAGVTCTPVGNNGVTISNTTTAVNLPYLSPSPVVTMSLRAKTPYAGGAPTGTFFQRADTGANDIVATSPIEQVDVTGAAGGSRNFLFPPICDVELDKQISCDGGTTWFDVGFHDGLPVACSATDPTLIKVQYVVHNPSATLNIGGCSLTESNGAFGTPGAVGAIGPDGQVTIPGTLTPACTNAIIGEPNTATVTCNICQGVPAPDFGDTDEANLVCSPVVALKVDRNVDCGPVGANNTGGSADGLLTEFNGDGTNGCSAFDGGTVEFEYVAKNEGSRTLYDCTFVDTSAVVGATGTPYVIGDLAAGQQVNVSSAIIPRLSQLCGNTLETSEVPNLGHLNLVCCTSNVDGILNCADADTVQRYDISTVNCLTPGVDVSKVCVDVNQDGKDDLVRITTMNTGEIDLTTCTVTDDLAGFGPITPIVPDTFPILLPETTVISEGALPDLTADALNTATVVCTAADGHVYNDTGTALCHGQGRGDCLTRTPGFWGTHPAVTAKYLTVDVCGVTIDNVLPNSSTSSTEAMCSVGKDGKIMGEQMTQLVRQCTAAALNIAATQALGGNCNTSPATEGIDATYAACCGAESICTDNAVEGYSVNSCIYALDTFNNTPDDTLNFDYPVGKAQPSYCQQSKNNGIVVDPTP